MLADRDATPRAHALHRRIGEVVVGRSGRDLAAHGAFTSVVARSLS
jgi:hypothetical protein